MEENKKSKRVVYDFVVGCRSSINNRFLHSSVASIATLLSEMLERKRTPEGWIERNARFECAAMSNAQNLGIWFRHSSVSYQSRILRGNVGGNIV
jgi:hypothetical protein